MAKDLAIDVGIPIGSNEYETFVGCVNNILTHGCGYEDGVTENIMEKCRTSKLPIAQKVLQECRRISRNTSGIRPSRLKWWEKYYQKKDGDVPRWPGKRANRQPDKRSMVDNRQPDKRSMSPMFDKRRPHKRPMSPMFDKRQRRPHKRPMSPMFDKRQRRPHKRPMSPMFDKRQRPHENRRYDDRHQGPTKRKYRDQRSPSPVYNTKKRRYR